MIILKSKLARSAFIIVMIIFAAIVIFVHSLTLQKSHIRSIDAYTLDSTTQDDIRNLLDNISSEDVIINRCCDFVCQNLNFSANNSLINGKANCVGYAKYTSAVLNYAFRTKNLPYKAYPVVGYVYCFGHNLHPLITRIIPTQHKSFVKDHDFVEIRGPKNIIYIDTSLQDLTGRYFYYTR